VTACNPRGQLVGTIVNGRLMKRLENDLAKHRKKWIRVDGRSPDGAHIEPGCAFNASREEAVAVGSKWRQAAVFWFDRRRVWLVPTGVRARAVSLPMKAAVGARLL
jgi:hypothetical protein